MSRATRPSYDVFLSHDPGDNALAGAVVKAFETEGLSAFSPYVTEAKPHALLSETVRSELFDSFNFAILLTPTFLASSVLPFQLGAASVHQTPTYLLRSGLSQESVPDYLRKYPSGELWADFLPLVAKIRQHAAPLSPAQTQALIDAYQEAGVSVDTLLVSPELRSDFLTSFADKSQRRVPSERVLRELIRLRKTGHLPRLASRSSK